MRGGLGARLVSCSKSASAKLLAARAKKDSQKHVKQLRHVSYNQPCASSRTTSQRGVPWPRNRAHGDSAAPGYPRGYGRRGASIALPKGSRSAWDAAEALGTRLKPVKGESALGRAPQCFPARLRLLRGGLAAPHSTGSPTHALARAPRFFLLPYFA